MFSPSAAAAARASNTPNMEFAFRTVIPGANVGKVSIPERYVLPTQGKQRYRTVCDLSGELKQGAKDFSLCIKSQNNTCRMGEQCHQLHISPAFFEDTNFWCEVKKTCCIEHRDYSTRDPAAQSGILSRRFEITGSPASPSMPVPVPSSRLMGRTLGLEKLLKEGRECITIPFRQICRLHGTDDCRFGGDCGRIHICREFASTSLHTAPLVAKQRRSSNPEVDLDTLLTPCYTPERRTSPDSSVGSSPGYVSPTEPTMEMGIGCRTMMRGRANTQPPRTPPCGTPAAAVVPSSAFLDRALPIDAPFGTLSTHNVSVLPEETAKKPVVRELKGQATEQEVAKFKEALKILIATSQPTPIPVAAANRNRAGTPPPRF